MNVFESIRNNIKESEEYYAKCIKNGTDINTEYFSSQSEAEQFAEKATKEHEYDEVDVYKSSNDDCIGVYETVKESDDKSKEERIKWLEDALTSIYSYGIRACVNDQIVKGITNADSYGKLADEYKELTGENFNIKKHIKESEEGERVDLFLRNDYGDWIDFLWYYPSSGKFFATFENVSHAEAWKRLNDPQVKKAVQDSWGDDTEKVYKEMIDYLKSCDDLEESELKESYDTYSVIEGIQSDINNLIKNLEGQNSRDVGTDVVIQALKSILSNIDNNMKEVY